MADKAYLDRLTKELVDKGCLIEAGWVSLRKNCIDPNASALQLEEMRMAFMAGAQHLFASIITVLDEDSEPTEDDLRRLDLINDELEKFVEELKLKMAKVMGRA